MKRFIIGLFLVSLGMCCNSNDLIAQELVSQIGEKTHADFSNEPSLKLPEALMLAQKYIGENNIDVSKHYLDNIRLLFNSSWMKGKHWIITWRLNTPVDGGEIFIIVGMDKKIKVHKGI